ncbi:MAG: TIGR03435 family protein [Terriglobia bacterium]
MKKLFLGLAVFVLSSGCALMAQDLAGSWQGTLHAGQDLRTVFKISKPEGGTQKAVLYSIDQGGGGISGTVTRQGSTIKMDFPGIGGTYEGKLDSAGTVIVGSWTQGGKPLPLDLKLVTGDAVWPIPAPPPPMKPMAPDANPVFEVATIKPSSPDEKGKFFTVRGRRFLTGNTTLSDLLTFSYGIHVRQIVNGPDWLNSEKFDINAEPGGEGQPNDKQWKSMIQKLLADRFKLTYHHEKRDLSVYALVVAKGGPKLTPSTGDPNGLPGMFFRGFGDLPARNANMGDFAGLLQSAVLDRPVVDQTGLTGRFDFALKWTPDETQFASFGPRPPTPPGEADAPDLFTAMQQQLGLKLDAVKAPTEVMVIDHVEKPSPN